MIHAINCYPEVKKKTWIFLITDARRVFDSVAILVQSNIWNCVALHAHPSSQFTQNSWAADDGVRRFAHNSTQNSDAILFRAENNNKNNNNCIEQTNISSK